MRAWAEHAKRKERRAWSEARAEAPIPRKGAKRTVLAAIRKIPTYIRLFWGLLTDDRVSPMDKLLVGAALAYVVMPFDLIPDFIPFLGQVDDIYVVMLALDRLISHAEPDVIADHWDGDPRDLTPASLEAVLMAAAFFLPFSTRVQLRRRLKRHRV